MRRRLAARAEVVRRRDEAAAEVVLPKAIHHHARGERVRGIGNPVREFEPAARRAIFRQWLAAENLREVTRDFLAEALRVAAHMETRVGGLALGDGVGEFVGEGFARLLVLRLRGGDGLGGFIHFGLLLRRIGQFIGGGFRGFGLLCR